MNQSHVMACNNDYHQHPAVAEYELNPKLCSLILYTFAKYGRTGFPVPFISYYLAQWAQGRYLVLVLPGVPGRS